MKAHKQKEHKQQEGNTGTHGETHNKMEKGPRQEIKLEKTQVKRGGNKFIYYDTYKYCSGYLVLWLRKIIKHG